MGDGSGPKPGIKYYRLTDKGKKQLVVEASRWRQMAEAVTRVIWSATGES